VKAREKLFTTPDSWKEGEEIVAGDLQGGKRRGGKRGYFVQVQNRGKRKRGNSSVPHVERRGSGMRGTSTSKE